MKADGLEWLLTEGGRPSSSSDTGAGAQAQVRDRGSLGDASLDFGYLK
jgi:hypothetical protein